MNLDHTDDGSLIRLIAGGQADALRELYDRYNRLVFSVALAIVGDRSTAEEVTLDVFVHVWRSAKTYRPELAKVSTWLVAITRHHAIDILRWQKSHPELNNLDFDEAFLSRDSAVADTEEQVENSLQRERIKAAVADLPKEQRQVLFLAYFKGLTHRQVAELLAQPLGTVKTRIRLAMQKLRQLLQEDEPPAETSENPESTYSINKKQ